jgi:mycothiol synthase
MFAALENTIVALPAGFTMRPVEMSDLAGAVAMFNANALASIGRETFNEDDIRAEWKREDFHLATATQAVFSPTGQLVGYMEVWDVHAVPVNPWVWGRVHPQFEGLGIGTALLTWAEERVKQVFARVPADARVTMRAGHVSTYQPARDLLLGYGLTPVRSFWTMAIDLVEPPATAVFPPHITICTMADRNDVRAIYRATNEAFQDHWGYVSQPEEAGMASWQQWLNTDALFDPSLWFLALDGDEIAAVSLCRRDGYEEPEMGWVNTLGVRRPWRRQGLALALLQHSFQELYRRGKRAVGLGVDAESLTGAHRLYEKAGMHVHRQFINYEKVLRPGRDLSMQALEE